MARDRRERILYLVPSPWWPYLNLGMVFILDSYGCLENYSYATNFLDQLLLQDKSPFVVDGYKN